MPEKQNGALKCLRKLKEQLLVVASTPSASVPISRSGLAFLSAIAAIAILTFVVFPTRRVTVSADGVSHVVQTREQSGAAIVRRAGLSLESGDIVLRKSDRSGEPVLTVQRATPVVAETSGQLIYWRTQAKTVGGILDLIYEQVVLGPDSGSPRRFPPN